MEQSVCTHSNVPIAQKSITIGGEYRILRKIQSGTFGDVYLGMCVGTREFVAIKRESTQVDENSALLFHETRMYNRLNVLGDIRNEFFPIFYGFFPRKDYLYLVMELLGPSLNDLFYLCGKKFSLKTVLMIALQMIERLETIHEVGLVHQDIKPENILIGIANISKLYIVDLGLARPFRLASFQDHFPIEGGKSIVGTARYASLNSHLGFLLSRRDDMESLGYLLVYFLKGSLPWSKKGTYDPNDVSLCKKFFPVSELCKGLHPVFQEFIERCRAFTYEEMPDYANLKQMFRSAMQENRILNDLHFDWCNLDPVSLFIPEYIQLDPIERSKRFPTYTPPKTPIELLCDYAFSSFSCPFY